MDAALVIAFIAVGAWAVGAWGLAFLDPVPRRVRHAAGIASLSVFAVVVAIGTVRYLWPESPLDPDPSTATVFVSSSYVVLAVALGVAWASRRYGWGCAIAVAMTILPVTRRAYFVWGPLVTFPLAFATGAAVLGKRMTQQPPHPSPSRSTAVADGGSTDRS